MNSQILCKITEKTASAEEFAEENHKVMPSAESTSECNITKYF